LGGEHHPGIRECRGGIPSSISTHRRLQPARFTRADPSSRTTSPREAASTMKLSAGDKPFALQNIRILDFSRFLASAGGTRFLGALGRDPRWKEGGAFEGISRRQRDPNPLQKMTKLGDAEQKSVEEDPAFLQDLVAAMPCANRAQSGSERVHGSCSICSWF
jgi:hypothetical protein